MKTFEHKRCARSGVSLLRNGGTLLSLISIAAAVLNAQTTSQASLAQKVAQLTDAMGQAEAKLEQTQRDLEDMHRQLVELQRQIAPNGGTPAGSDDPALSTYSESGNSTTAAIDDLRERQSIQEEQIATQEQTKVESESRYPVKITGMLLMNGFVNTSAVNIPAAPSVALGGPGNAGATVSQTILGIDAHGPDLFGARSFGDLRVDFFGSQVSSATITDYSGAYTSNSAFLRLRTAHAGLEWDRTQVYFALDRPILSPDTPTSLTAVAVPALAWSGNLWTWNPQAVFSRSLSATGSSGLQLQAALIDVGDAPLTPALPPSTTAVTYLPPTSAQLSGKPGVEARVAWLGSGRDDSRMHIGAGGYFAPHTSALGPGFDSWASTLDVRLPLFARLELAGNFYRGAALGGLGAGGYKDFAYSPDLDTGGFYFRPLDDVGGWVQLKEKPTERLEFNAAYGMDNVFAGELRPYYSPSASLIQNLARNRTVTGNVIYSPSAYLLFSLEYRRLASTPVEYDGATSNVIGVGAGYRF